MTQIVHSITSATITVLEINPPILEIRVEGETTTPHWEDFAVEHVVANPPPADGVYEAKMVGTPPGGILPQVMTPFAHHEKWENYPHNVEGLRLISATNAVIARL